MLGHHLATNSFGLGRLFYKSSRQLQNFRRHGDQNGPNLEGWLGPGSTVIEFFLGTFQFISPYQIHNKLGVFLLFLFNCSFTVFKLMFRNFNLQISRHVLFRESLAGFPIVAWLNFKQFKLKTVLQANSCVVEQQTSNLLLFEYMYNVFWENLLSLTKGGSTNQ